MWETKHRALSSGSLSNSAGGTSALQFVPTRGYIWEKIVQFPPGVTWYSSGYPPRRSRHRNSLGESPRWCCPNAWVYNPSDNTHHIQYIPMHGVLFPLDCVPRWALKHSWKNSKKKIGRKNELNHYTSIGEAVVKSFEEVERKNTFWVIWEFQLAKELGILADGAALSVSLTLVMWQKCTSVYTQYHQLPSKPKKKRPFQELSRGLGHFSDVEFETDLKNIKKSNSVFLNWFCKTMMF